MESPACKVYGYHWGTPLATAFIAVLGGSIRSCPVLPSLACLLAGGSMPE